MARRTKEEAELTRLAIMRSALDIFCEKGYSKTTFDEIAKRINLTKGAVYWHFRNKPDIITTLMKEAFYRANEIISQKVPEIASLGDLKAYFLYDAELIKDNSEYRKFLFFIIFQMEWSETLFNKIGGSVKEIRDFPIKKIKEALTNAQKSGEISPDINLDQMAVTVFSLWTGMLNYSISNNAVAGFPELFGKSFDCLIRGLKDERS